MATFGDRELDVGPKTPVAVLTGAVWHELYAGLTPSHIVFTDLVCMEVD